MKHKNKHERTNVHDVKMKYKNKHERTNNSQTRRHMINNFVLLTRAKI